MNRVNAVSEIKALLVWPGLPREPNLAAIDHYLTLQYVPGAETAFTGIRRLPPAHYLVVGADADGHWRDPELVRYWSLPEPRAAGAPEDWAEERDKDRDASQYACQCNQRHSSRKHDNGDAGPVNERLNNLSA